MKLAIVGEALGEHEEREGRPFVGPSGRILMSVLQMLGIERNECLVTNVFNIRPKPSNDVSNLCGVKANGIPDMPYLIKGKYVDIQYANELLRLRREIKSFEPNCILALGNTPCWALLKKIGIGKLRGVPYEGWNGYKVLPTYHPAAIMRNWKLRPIMIADIDKAKRQADFPEITRPRREIWTEPTIDDLWKFYELHIKPLPRLSIDIETRGPQITCIGFAPTVKIALTVPFHSRGQDNGNYWKTLEEEMKAWDFVRTMCGLKKEIVGQNFLYDMQYLWKGYGIPVPHQTDDTMLLHHALQPEMDKGLAFLGSVYTEEPAWKYMRDKGGTIKKED